MAEFSQVRLTTQHLSMPAGDIAFRDTGGSGLPIVMLHGVGASKDVFTRQMDSPLAEAHRLIALDLPGHGASSNAADPDADYTVPAAADLVAAFAAALRIDRALVLGWSLGGHLAIEMMSRHPRLLAGVMVCGTAPARPGPLAALRAFHANWDLLLASREVLTTRDAERFARMCFGDHVEDGHIEMILRTDGRMRPRINRSLMYGTDQKWVVETSPVPLAVVNGTNEPVVRLGYVAGIDYANLWEGRCHLVPDAGHAPFFTAPNVFNAILHRFATDMAMREAAGRSQRRIARSA